MHRKDADMIRSMMQNVFSRSADGDILDIICDYLCIDDSERNDPDIMCDAYEMLDAWHVLQGWIASHGLESIVK